MRTVMFPEPTDATNAMLDAIRPEVPALFLPGTRYRKTGVVFFGLEKANAPRQLDLFSPDLRSPFPVPRSPSPLYKAIDAINARYGKGKVFSASEGIGESSEHPARASLRQRNTVDLALMPHLRQICATDNPCAESSRTSCLVRLSNFPMFEIPN